MKKIIFILLTAFFIVSIFGSAYAAIKISKYHRSESSTTAGFSLIENEVYFNQLMELSNVSVKFTQDASNYIFNIKGNIALDVYNDVTHTTFYGSASALSPMLYKSENFGEGMYVQESSKVPFVDFVSGSLYSTSTVKILNEKIAWYNESYNQLSNGDVSNYVNDNDGNGDKYYIPNSLRNISSGSYNYRYATQYPICVKNNGTGVSILQNSSSHKFNTMSNGMVNNYTANVNIKISIKKSYIDDYRYICFAQSYFVNTEESFKELYDSVRGISLCTQTIDLKEYAECDHNWIITSVDGTNHTKRCNDCEWEITEAHDFRYEYDGIAKDLCSCGYKKQIYHHYIYNSSQVADNKVKINVNGTYTKPSPTKTGYKIASIDRYFKYYSNMTKPVFSESNTSLTKTYVDNLPALPDNAGTYSTVFEWKYNSIKYKIHYDTVNNLGATINLSLSDINNCEYDKEYSLSSPVIAHYIFKGWTTTKGSSEVKVTAKAKNLTTTDGATVNLYPVLEYNDYTFKFSNENNLNLKLNGSIADLKCNSFTKYNLPNNIEVTGYTFLGWGLSKNNTVNFSPKAEIYNYTSDEHKKITLYPIYRVNKYKIHYDNENNLGATINLKLEDINNCEYDKEYSLSSPVIAHYIFKGWATTKGSSESNVTSKIKNLTSLDGAIVNLYPIFEYNDYTFKFSNENNLNLKLNGSIADLKCNSFTKYNLPNNIEVTGYTFLGWGLSKNNTVNFSPKAEIYNYTSDEHKKITLYPIYRVNKYKIHYDNENNLGAAINLKLEDINNCEYNKEYSLSSPVIAHYIFKGWTTTKGSSEVKVTTKAKNLTTTDGATVNLYPVLEYNDYTFKFSNENNLNLPLNEEIPEMKCYSYTKYNLPDNIAVTGHTFLGWGLATTSDIEFGPNEEIFNWTEEEHKDIVLYPLYRTNKYKVHFSAQNNMIPNISFDLNDLDCEYNSEYNLPSVKLVNYIFRGWSTENKNEIKFKLNDKIRNLSSDDNDVVNLYPVFDINYYIMHFSKENNRNLEIDEEIDDLKCNANEKYVLPNHIDIDGYIFNGWSLTKDGSVTFKANAELFNYTTEEDMEYVLYPNYTPIEYTIKYSNENMQNVDLGNNIFDQTYVYDEPQKLKDNIDINGYEFKGWSTNLSSEEVELKPNENILNYTNENNKIIILYPIYTPAQFKIIYNTYNGQYSNGKNSIAKEYSILTTKDFEIPKIKDIDHYNKYDELYAKEIAVFDKYIDDDDVEYNSIQDIINNVISDNTYYASYNLTCNYHLEKKYFPVQDRDSGSSATGKIPGIITDDDIFNRERESLANAENEKYNETIVNTIEIETKVEADNIANQETEGMLNNLLNNVILLYQNTKEKLLDEKSKLSSEDGEVQAHSVTETEEEAPYIKNAIDISNKKIRSNSDSAKNISASKFQLFLLGLIKHKEIVILTLSSELALLFIYVLYRRRKERSNTSEE